MQSRLLVIMIHYTLSYLFSSNFIFALITALLYAFLFTIYVPISHLLPSKPCFYHRHNIRPI